MSYLVSILLSVCISVSFCIETSSILPSSTDTTSENTQTSTEFDIYEIITDLNEIITSPTNITIHWDGTNEDNYTLYLQSIGPLYFYSEDCSIHHINNENKTDETEFTFTDLHPYYNYSIQIENAIGTSEPFYVQTNQTTPEPVINLLVTNHTISWDLPCEVNGDLMSFSLKITANDTNQIRTVDKIDNEINYKQDFSWNPSMLYEIEVKAVLENGIEGKPSSISFDTAVPGPPKQITIDSINDTAFTLSWTEPEDPNGEIFDYKLELIDYGPIYVLGDDCPQPNSNSTSYANDLSHNFDGLMPYYNYSVRIQARNFAGYGEVAEESVKTDQAPPSNIRDFHVNLKDSSTDSEYNVKIIITWSVPCEINGELHSFSIKINDHVKYEEYKPGQTMYSVEESNVSPFTNYTVQVAAHLTNGMSSAIVEANIFTPEFIPDTVNDIEIYNVTSNNFSITWKEPILNGELTNYNITLNNLGPLYKVDENLCEINNESYTIATIETEYFFYDLFPFYQYSVEIKACTKIGCSLNVNEKLVNTDSSIPEKPTNLQLINISEIITMDEYTVNKSIVWDDPCMQNGKIDHYSILILSFYTEDIHLSNVTNVTIDYDELNEINLLVEPSRTYLFHIWTVLEYDVKGENEILRFDTPVGYPSTVSIQSHTHDASSFTIRWYEPTPEAGKIENYEVVFYDFGPQYNIIDDTCEKYNKNNTVEYTSYKYYHIENLMSYYDYGVEIYASTSAGFGRPTDIIRFRTDSSIPSPVRNFHITVDNSTKTANISWDVPCLINGELKEFLLTINQENQNLTETQNIPFENDLVKYFLNLQDLEMGTKYNLYISVLLNNGLMSANVSLSFSLPKDDDPNNIIIILLSTLIPITIIGALVAFFIWKKKPHFGYCPIIANTKPDSIPPTPKPSKNFLDRDIVISKYQSYYKKLMENPYLLKEQYNLINEECKKFDVTYDFALKTENRRKNRYVNILPYDSTRVRLNMDEDDEISSDYINASYIKGYSGAIEYIATQGPLKLTCKDFWNMIIDEHVTIIAMVAQFHEQNKEKCYKYLPDNFEEISLGPDFKIKCETALLFSSYSVRTILVQKGDSKHHITHFQYLDWPDFGVPSSTESLLFFCHKVRERVEFDGGLIAVHCSAGVGRTGTLIAIDILLQMLKRENKVNIYKVVLDLRKQRTKMVQAEAQYVFIHTCISDYLENPNIEDEESMYENLSEPIYENIPAQKLIIEENVL